MTVQKNLLLHEFAQVVGCSVSMASLIRAGRRRPSTRAILELHRRYGFPLQVMLEAHADGPEAFGAWAREHVFEPSPMTTAEDTGADA